MQEYLFRVIKEQFVRVESDNLEDAKDIAAEQSLINTEDDEVIKVELVDSVEKENEYYDDSDLYDDYDIEEMEEYLYGV